MAVQWVAYVWPDLTGRPAPMMDTGWPALPGADPWEDIWKLLNDVVLPALWRLDPDFMLEQGPGADPDADVDGGADGEPLDGVDPGVDGGTDPGGVDGGLDSGSSDRPHVPYIGGTWKVISPRISGSIDVQMMAAAATFVPGVIERGVTVPSECGTPLVGDVGTVWHLRDGAVIFLPAMSMPPAAGTPHAIGSTDEAEAAHTGTWDASVPPAGTDGLAFTMLTRLAYDDTGDEKLYAYYRVGTFNERGQISLVGAEARVIIDTPGACP